MVPQDVWQNFYELTQIPRPSHHEEQVRDFLVQFGQDLGLETIVDDCPSSNPDQQVVILGDLQPGQVWMASYAVLTGEAPDLTVVESVMVPIRTIWK